MVDKQASWHLVARARSHAVVLASKLLGALEVALVCALRDTATEEEEYEHQSLAACPSPGSA